jgi:Delta7-sterol 5-desaturase
VLDFLFDLAKSYFGTVMLQFTLLTVIWLVVWKWVGPRLPAARIQPNSKISARQIRREIRNGLFVLLVSTLLATVGTTLSGGGLMVGVVTDFPNVAWIIWTVLSVPLLLFINDGWFYAVHRLLHSKWLYRLIHNEHHKSIDTTPYTSLSFHVLEPVLLTLWVVPAALILPVHLWTLAAVQAYGFFDNAKSHLGYEFFPAWFNRGPFRWFTTATYHNMHHRRYVGNYGLHFRLWDRVLGTELPDYDAVFDAIVARRREGAASEVEFVG